MNIMNQAPQQIPQQNNPNIFNNNNIWNDIFSAPVNNQNQNQNMNNQNNNMFNNLQQNQPQPQQNQQPNFGGFDFTNMNIEENRERVEQKNRLDKLENALNNLSMNNNQNGQMNMGMGNQMGGINLSQNTLILNFQVHRVCLVGL